MPSCKCGKIVHRRICSHFPQVFIIFSEIFITSEGRRHCSNSIIIGFRLRQQLIHHAFPLKSSATTALSGNHELLGPIFHVISIKWSNEVQLSNKKTSHRPAYRAQVLRSCCSKIDFLKIRLPSNNLTSLYIFKLWKNDNIRNNPYNYQLPKILELEGQPLDR